MQGDYTMELVIGINPKMTTAVILRNWFKWREKLRDNTEI